MTRLCVLPAAGEGVRRSREISNDAEAILAARRRRGQNTAGRGGHIAYKALLATFAAGVKGRTMPKRGVTVFRRDFARLRKHVGEEACSKIIGFQTMPPIYIEANAADVAPRRICFHVCYARNQAPVLSVVERAARRPVEGGRTYSNAALASVAVAKPTDGLTIAVPNVTRRCLCTAVFSGVAALAMTAPIANVCAPNGNLARQAGLCARGLIGGNCLPRLPASRGLCLKKDIRFLGKNYLVARGQARKRGKNVENYRTFAFLRGHVRGVREPFCLLCKEMKGICRKGRMSAPHGVILGQSQKDGREKGGRKLIRRAKGELRPMASQDVRFMSILFRFSFRGRCRRSKQDATYRGCRRGVQAVFCRKEEVSLGGEVALGVALEAVANAENMRP